VELLCLDPKCPGARTPAGELRESGPLPVVDDCRFCGRPLEDAHGNVYAVGRQLPAGMDAMDVLVEAMRGRGSDVRMFSIDAAEEPGGRVLGSITAEDGEVVTAELAEGPRAETWRRMREAMP
jgi:hypothetical protein